MNKKKPSIPIPPSPPIKVKISPLYVIGLSLFLGLINFTSWLVPRGAQAASLRNQSKELVSVASSSQVTSSYQPQRLTQSSPFAPRQATLILDTRSQKGRLAATSSNNEDFEKPLTCLTPNDLQELIDNSKLKIGPMLINYLEWETTGANSWELTRYFKKADVAWQTLVSN